MTLRPRLPPCTTASGRSNATATSIQALGDTFVASIEICEARELPNLRWKRALGTGVEEREWELMLKGDVMEKKFYL